MLTRLCAVQIAYSADSHLSSIYQFFHQSENMTGYFASFNELLLPRPIQKVDKHCTACFLWVIIVQCYDV